MCMRPFRCRPTVRAIKMAPQLSDKRNQVFGMVTPSSVTNFGSERDASRFSDKKGGFTMVTPSSVTKVGVDFLDF